jgi:hypothetical protein
MLKPPANLPIAELSRLFWEQRVAKYGGMTPGLVARSSWNVDYSICSDYIFCMDDSDHARTR